jgi:hypothetical protein
MGLKPRCCPIATQRSSKAVKAISLADSAIGISPGASYLWKVGIISKGRKPPFTNLNFQTDPGLRRFQIEQKRLQNTTAGI